MDSMDVFTENLFSFARMLGSRLGGGTLSGPSGSLAAASGLPYAGENYLLLAANASAFEAEQLIIFFEARALSFAAPVLPGISGKSLAALERACAAPSHCYTAMSLPLGRIRGGKAAELPVTVKNRGEAEEWASVVWRGFDGGEETPDDYLSLARHLANQPENGLYLLKESGKHVSCGLLHRTSNSCGLYYFATPPEHRRRGHAGRLMEALAIQAAREYKEMVLLATPQGLPFYTAFGFKALAEIPMLANTTEL